MTCRGSLNHQSDQSPALRLPQASSPQQFIPEVRILVSRDHAEGLVNFPLRGSKIPWHFKTAGSLRSESDQSHCRVITCTPANPNMNDKISSGLFLQLGVAEQTGSGWRRQIRAAMGKKASLTRYVIAICAPVPKYQLASKAPNAGTEARINLVGTFRHGGSKTSK
jgi:hypothetical protein